MIDLEVDRRGVATLTLARPEKHNALSQAMIEAVHGAAKTVAADRDIRVVVLAAEGTSFCAGGDLDWMRQQMAGGRTERFEAANALARMLQALNTLPQPLVGRIHGNAFGGGVGLASVCDVAIAADTVVMGLTETRLGLIPATIGPYLAARMGEARARQVFMSGRKFSADEAVALGIVTRAVPFTALDDAVEAEVAPYMACAPEAVASAKSFLRSLGPNIDESTIVRSIEALLSQWDTDVAEEGISAFFERRKPLWAQNNQGS